MTKFKTPGQLITSLLTERDWSQRLLASVLDISESTTNKLILGNQAVTAEIAICLEEVFNVPAEEFLTLQKDYDLARARLVARPDEGRVTRAKLFSGLPVAEMIKRHWLEASDIKNMPEIEAALAKFFRAPTINDIEFLAHAAKKTNAEDEITPVQLAWLYRVKQIAAGILAPAYSEERTRATLATLKSYLSAPQEARHVPRALLECGIRLVFVESLKGSKIDGACFWLDDKSPVIGMTLRFDRMDNFWFVLRHELEHVLQRHGQDKSMPMLDVDLNANNSIEEEERVANEAAQNFCAPQTKIDSFIARKAPLFPERDFLGLAKILGVHPALIAGQIQFKTGRYELFRGHLAKIRDFVLPSAIVDGWGDIAPMS